MNAHPWHDIPCGASPPRLINMVVEVPRKATTKYETDLDLGLLRINQVKHPSMPYPANYGFIPQTLDEDGDPLDALALMQDEAAPLTVLAVRPIGLAILTNDPADDNKVICVHQDDPMYRNYDSVEQLPDAEIEELEWFLDNYQDAKHRDGYVKGFLGLKGAYQRIRRCHKIYEERVEQPPR